MKAEKLINYVQLSKLLTGKRDVIRRDFVNKQNKDKVNELIKAIEAWIEKHGLNKTSGG